MSTFYYVPQYFTTQLSVAGGIDDTQTTGIVLQSISGVDETKPGIIAISWSNPIDTTKVEYITYTSINNTTKELQGVTRGQEGYSAKSHVNGATIAWPLSKSHINNIPDSTTTFTNKSMDYNSNTFTNFPTSSVNLFYNSIINGNMDVDQRVGPYTSGRNNDDVYVLDHWNLISDGNDVFDVSQEAITDLPGSNYAIKLDVETAKRGGIVQFLEAKDAQKFKGKYVSISFAVKSANISAIRAAVLSWGSTADAITSDVVGTWDATPTWAANWTAENTPADLTVTSSWTTVKIENIYIDSATVNNLALAIWLPNEETIGDIIYITQVQMNDGSVALPFMPESFNDTLIKCMRYYETSYNYGVLPGTATAYSGVGHLGNNGATTTSYIGTKLMFTVPKRAVGATMTFYDGAGTAGKCRRFTLDSSSSDGQNIASDSIDQKSTNVYSSGTSDNAGFVFQYVAVSEL